MTTTWTTVEERIVWTATEDPSYQFVTLRPTSVTLTGGGGGGGLELGETSSTAYRGDRGKTAYDHSQVTTGNPHGTTAADVGAQPADSDLTTIAGLTPTTDSFMQAKAGAWAARTIAQVKTDLGVVAAFPPPHLTLVDDLWLTAPNVPPNAVVAGATFSGSVVNAFKYVFICPIWVPTACQIDALAVYQSTAASDTGAVGLLALAGPGAAPFEQTSLVVPPTSFDATATAGARIVTFSPVSLSAGLHWGYIKFQMPSGSPSGTNPQVVKFPTGLPYGPPQGITPATAWGAGSGYIYGTGLIATDTIPSNLNTGVTKTWGSGNSVVWMGARVYV